MHRRLSVRCMWHQQRTMPGKHDCASLAYASGSSQQAKHQESCLSGEEVTDADWSSVQRHNAERADSVMRGTPRSEFAAIARVTASEGGNS